jgi:NADH-quinone oxidoreductase subunit N
MTGPVIASAVALLGQGSTTTTTTTPVCQIPPGGTNVTGLCTANGSLHIPIAYRSILPILVLSVGALLLLVVSAMLSRRSRPGLYCLLTVGIAGLGIAASMYEWYDVGGGTTTIGGQIHYDKFSVLFMLLVSIAVLLSAITSESYLRREGLDGVEAYVLLAMAGVGAMLMAASNSLIMLFLGLEIMSIALYVLAAYHRRRVESGEAGFKYFILGSFASAIFLYGIALVYGATGSVNFSNINLFLAQNTLLHSGVLLAGMGLLIVGLGFKVAAVPFHFWTPDVYQGSPTPFTGYMGAVAKAAGFAGLLRILVETLPSQEVNWRPIIWILAVLSLLVGSVLAISQRDLKRAFAFSSISQAGYILVGVEANSATGTAGALFYLFTYMFMVIGTFAILDIIQGRGEARNDLGAVRGLSRRDPLLAGAFLILLLAQAGIPFTSGFLAKFYVIDASLQRGQYWLSIIAMLAAALIAFFYLRVALLVYSPPLDATAAAGQSGSDEMVGVVAGSDPSMAGLEPVAALDPPGVSAVALEAPPTGHLEVPIGLAAVIALSVGFTIAAGVSGFMIDFAKAATF